MILNRRNLFKALAGMVAGGAVVTKLKPIPVSLPKPVRWQEAVLGEFDAIRFLSDNYNIHAKVGLSPHTMYVSQAMFERYESQLQACQRFCSVEEMQQGYVALAFKSARVMANPKFTIFHCEVTSRRRS